MSYDLFLIRDPDARLNTWEDVMDLHFPEEDADDPEDWAAYEPSLQDIEKADVLRGNLENELGPDIGVDLYFEKADMISIHLPYWPEILDKIDAIVGHLNAYARSLGPDWYWGDQQYETISKTLQAEQISEVFLSFIGDGHDDDRPFGEKLRQAIPQILICIAAAALGLFWLGGMGDDGCAPFEVPGEIPGTCDILCLPEENDRQCDARAAKLWKDAGIDPIPVDPALEPPVDHNSEMGR